jgi:hypothetical protein
MYAPAIIGAGALAAPSVSWIYIVNYQSGSKLELILD